MTSPVWDYDRCPKCNAQHSVELDANTRLCLECRHEWNAGTTTGPLVASPLVASVPPVALVPAWTENKPVDEWETYLSTARSTLVGAKAVYHDAGAEGTITEVTDDGFAIVTFGSGYYVELLPNEFTVTEADVIPDDKIAAIATTDITVAAQVIRAAVATIETVGDDRRMTMPPDGWLPDEPGVMPVIEHGAAYAVAYLAIQYGVATDQLVSIAEMLDNAAQAAEGANTNG